MGNETRRREQRRLGLVAENTVVPSAVERLAEDRRLWPAKSEPLRQEIDIIGKGVLRDHAAANLDEDSVEHHFAACRDHEARILTGIVADEEFLENTLVDHGPFAHLEGRVVDDLRGGGENDGELAPAVEEPECGEGLILSASETHRLCRHHAHIGILHLAVRVALGADIVGVREAEIPPEPASLAVHYGRRG